MICFDLNQPYLKELLLVLVVVLVRVIEKLNLMKDYSNLYEDEYD